MPAYQNGAVVDSSLIVGNYKVETAAYSASAHTAWTNIGAGKVNKFGHNISMIKVQAGNAPDPLEGVGEETFTVDMELIEFNGTAISALSGGAATATTVSSVTTINGGGNGTVTPFAVRLTNTRMISAATHQTIITIYKCTMDTGIQVTAKSDNDTDPINVWPITLTGKIDGNRTAGSQLFQITKDT
jgi:hypothetical protein